MHTPRHRALVLREVAHAHPEQVAQRVRVHGAWEETTYDAMLARVDHLTSGLVAWGIAPGDRVGIFAGNRPEWHLTDFALMGAGAVSVTLYQTSTAAQVRYILADAGAVAVVVAGAEEAAKIASVREHLPSLRAVIWMDETEDDADGTTSVTTLMRRGEEQPDPEIETRLAAADLDAPFTIIYTSGTTGDPKGVMLSQTNMDHVVHQVVSRFPLDVGDRSLSFLPLSHAFERGWCYVAFASGASTSYVTDPKEVASYLPDVKPDIMVAVPRLFEKVYEMANAKAGDGVKRRIFDSSLATGVRYELARRAGTPVSPALKVRYALADRLVLSTIRKGVGGPKKTFASGGAPLRQVVEEFFFAAGVQIHPGYGLTEASPLISCNTSQDFRFGSVGKIVDGMEARLTDEGELLVRGPNITAGYWGKPEATAEAIDTDGFLHTGDIVRFDEDGFLFITDRAKDLIITAQGKNVAPAVLEDALSGDPLVEYAAVIGDGRRYLTAIIQPSFEALGTFAAEHGLPTSDQAALVRHPSVLAEMERRIAHALRDFAGFEQVKKFRLVDRPFTMDAGDITPTLKLRRRKVESEYVDLIEEMYAEG